MTDFAGENTDALLSHEELRILIDELTAEIHEPKTVDEDRIDIRFHAHNSYLTLRSICDSNREYKLSLHTTHSNDGIEELSFQWNFAFMPVHQAPIFRVDCGCEAFHKDEWLKEVFEEGHLHFTDSGLSYAITIREAREYDLVSAIVDISLGSEYEDLTVAEVLYTVLLDLGVNEEEAEEIEMRYVYALESA